MKTQTGGMAVVENTIDIRSSPEDVFDYCTNLAREPEWNPKAKRVEKVSAGPIGLGTRYEAEFLKGNPTTIEFVRFDRPIAWDPSVALAAWMPGAKGGSPSQRRARASSCGWS